MIVRPWRDGDFRNLELQSAQDYLLEIVPDGGIDLSPLVPHGLAWTGLVDDEVVAIGGVEPIWKDRALAFMFISSTAGPHFRSIHRHVYRFLENVPFRRVEANVDIGFSEGARWMKMLGFELEGYMRAYRPDGADMLLYARVKGCHSLHH